MYPRVNAARLTASRLLLAGGAFGLLIVAVYHTAGYITTALAIANSSLQYEMQQSFKALWLGFSLQALITALVVLVGALRPHAISAAVLLICALLPSLNAAVLFHFVGSFFGAIVLAVSGLLVILGAAVRPPIVLLAPPPLAEPVVVVTPPPAA